MNALRLAAALVAVALLCSLSAPPVQAQAVVNTDVTTIPLDFIQSEFNSDGVIEKVHYIGETQMLSHTTLNANQGMTHLILHTHAIGVGLKTGEHHEYLNSETLRFTFDRVPVEFTYVHDVRRIAPGPDNNDFIHETIHFTINANGELTADVDNSWSTIQ